MALSPGAGAVTPHATVTHTAPYTGTHASISKSTSTYGSCTASGKLTSLKWVPTTGNLTGVASGKGSGCATPPFGDGSASGSASATIDVAFPWHVTSGGHNITVDTSYMYKVTAAFTGHLGCKAAVNVPGHYTYNSCSISASAGASWGFELYDATNNSYLSGSHTSVTGPQNYTDVYNDSSCNGLGTCTWYNSTYGCSGLYYYANCVPSGTTATGFNSSWLNTSANCQYSSLGHCYSWYNWTLVGTDSYWVVVYLSFSAYASIYGYAAAHSATASLNGGSLGLTGWKVTSIAVA